MIINPFRETKNEIVILACPVDRFLIINPHCKEVIQAMVRDLPKRRFLNVRLIHKNYQVSEWTCTNVNPHVDGINNFYSLICWGDFRTEFYKGPSVLIPESLDTPRERSQFIEEMSLDNSLFDEIDEGVIKYYSSLDIHKGRVFTSDGSRTFLRVMSTDNPSGKSFVIKKAR